MEAIPSNHDDSESRELLIIEDDRSFAQMLQQMLSRHRYKVTVAHDGGEALAALASCKFDLVMLDILIPDRDGLEVLKLLRELDPELPVVAMSGGIHRDVSWLSLITETYGATQFLKKPFTHEEILAALDRAH